MNYHDDLITHHSVNLRSNFELCQGSAAASSWILRLIKWVSLAAECSIIFHLMSWKSLCRVTAWKKKKLLSHFHCYRRYADKNGIRMRQILSGIFINDIQSIYFCDLACWSGYGLTPDADIWLVACPMLPKVTYEILACVCRAPEA